MHFYHINTNKSDGVCGLTSLIGHMNTNITFVITVCGVFRTLLKYAD